MSYTPAKYPEVTCNVTDSHHARPSTPLGGSSRRQSKRNTFYRNWTGYVPLVRTCPRCGTENNQQHQFCAGCAASIAELEATPSENPHSGVLAMEERIRREADDERRQRPFASDSGTGMVMTGVMLLLITVWFPLPWMIRLSVWAVGIVMASWGLVRMRSDGGALRRTGLILGASTIGLVALVVTRGTPPADPALLSPTVSPTEAVVSVATPVASPVSSQAFGSVPTLLGDSGHSGLQPGPAPQMNPALAWRFDSGSEILASPIIADGIVYVTNRAGFLYAIDAATGKQLWRAEVGPYVLRTTPTWHDGALYLVAGFDAISLDAATGQERWRVTIRYAGTASPTVSDGAMFVVSQEGLLYALDISGGAELWRITTDGISFGSPAASSGRLVVATDRGIVVGLNPETGRASWRRDFDVPIYTTAAITGDTVWIVTTDGVIRGLDLDNGGDQTNVTTNSDLTVTADDGVVFAPSDDGGIYAIVGESGNVDWFASTGGEVRSGPVRTESQVIATGGNRIAGFDIETGEQIWYYLAGDSIEASPAVVSDYVFFGARDGVLYAITVPEPPADT